MESDEIRQKLFKILKKNFFGKPVYQLGYAGEQYKEGERTIEELIPGLKELKDIDIDFICEHGKKIAEVDSDAGFYYFLTAPQALKVFGKEDFKKWVDLGYEILKKDLKEGKNYFKGLTKEIVKKVACGLKLEEISNILSLYLQALSGYELNISESVDGCYTNGKTIFLPKRIDLFENEELNFKLYKVMASHKYAQLVYGTFFFRLENVEDLVNELKKKYGNGLREDASDFENFFNLFPNKNLALNIFSIVEDARIERNLKKDFKGLKRDLEEIQRLEFKKISFTPRNEVESLLYMLFLALTFGKRAVKDFINDKLEEDFEKIYEIAKKAIKGNVYDVLRATARIYEILDKYSQGYTNVFKFSYRGEIMPEKVTIGIRELKNDLKEALEEIFEDFDIKELPEINSQIQSDMDKLIDPLYYTEGITDFLFRIKMEFDDEMIDEVIKEIEKKLAGKKLDPNMFIKVLHDTGRKIRANIKTPENNIQVSLTKEDIENAILYDEWDYKLNSYRVKWCALKEMEMKKGSLSFYERTIKKHRALVENIKKQFEMLRMDYKKLKKQKDGDVIDIDAFVEAFTDMKAGISPREDIYIRNFKRERDIAVAFLVDMSGSTAGWVIETEKEALILLCEALEILGDKYGIFGFTSKTRKQCEFYIIKKFDEDFNDDVKRRIAGMDALDYTRMGPAIRHVTKLLDETDARLKLLILITDGKPEDYDEYKGDHGIEDTRKALIEAKQKGIKPFCITIDKEANKYIHRMFGEVGYIILDNVEKLPRKLPEIYRKLTT